MEVSLQSVSFFDFDTNVPLGSRKKLEKYLDNASISISAGSVVAIIGSPTYSRHLLELVSLRKRKGHIAGHINHDSSIRKNGSHFRDVAYVKDFDSHYFDYLTVFDFLWWAARLRLTLSLAECSTRAREAALLVDLNCLSWVRELNSGQRILLALASELVSSPSLICVENAIDFKEEAHALSVAKMFTKVAHRVNTSTTIVFSCVAPSYHVLQCVDQIVVQFESKILYSSGRLLDKSELVLYPGRDYAAENPQTQDTLDKILEVVSTISREYLRCGYGSSFCLGDGTNPAYVSGSRRGGVVTAQSHYQRENAKLKARVEKHVEELMRLQSVAEQTAMTTPPDKTEENNGLTSPAKAGDSLVRSESPPATPSSLALSITPSSPIPPLSPQPYTPTGKPASAGNGATFNSGSSFAAGPSRRRRLHPSRLVKSAHPVSREIWGLVTRAIACMRGNPVLMVVGVIRFMISGIILGLSSLNAGDDAAYMKDDDIDFKLGNDDIINDDSFSVTSTLFFVVVVILLGLTFSVPYMNSHFRMIRSEIVSGIYHPISAWVAIMILDIPSQLLGCIFLGLVIRLFLGLNGDGASYYSGVTLCALAGVSMASAVAVAFRSAYKATQVYMSLIAIMTLFAGYLQYIPEMPAAFAWLSDLSVARWSFEALMLSSFQSSKTGEAYLELYGFDDQHVSACVVWLLLWVLVLQIGVLVGLYPIQYQSVYARVWGRQQSALTTSATVGSAGQRAAQAAGASDVSYLLADDADVADDVINLRLVDSDFGENDDRYLDGTYHIPQAERKFSDDEHYQPPPVPIELLPANKRTSLSFHRVGYTLPGSQSSSSLLAGAPTETQVVLKDITGVVYPGDLCCILDADDEGANGVLLQVLGGRASKTGVVTGEIHMSDKLIRQGDRTHNAVFVMTGDSPAHSLLTVRETLRFATLLRRTDQRSCPLVIGVLMESQSVRRLLMNQPEAGRTEEEIQAAELVGSSGQVEEKVEELLRIFDLEEVADTVVGRDKERRISPSHLRCLTIAIEAVNRPGLLLLPDPLFHLDWYHTDRVCRVLRALANGGRTIVCTIPNPTDQIYAYFNRTLLLNKGLLMYAGPTADAREHFANIGFQPTEKQSTLDYLMDICREKAVLSSVSTAAGKRSSLLTAEDLANIRQSMDGSAVSGSRGNFRSTGASSTNSSSGRKSNSIDEPAAASLVEYTGEKSSDGDTHLSTGPVIMRGDTPLGPSARVMLLRRTTLSFRNRRMVFYYQIRSVFVSVLLGCIWFDIDNGEVESRVLLSSVAYVYIVASLADLFDGTHRRQADYLRERANGAASAAGYWWADLPPVFVHTLPQAFVFSTPFYTMAGLRNTFGAYAYFCFILFLGLICNIGLMYFVSALMKNPRVSQVLFLGVILPLQILFSGSVVYLSSMSSWLSWGALLNPMHFFLTGVFENEFEGNNGALGDKAYEAIKNEYGFIGNSDTSVIALIVIGVVYRLLWLLSLKHRELIQQRHVLQKAVKAAQRKVKVLVTAGLRFSKRNDGYTDAADLDEDFGENGFPALHHDEEVQATYQSAVANHQQAVLNQLYRQELAQPESQEQRSPSTSSARLSRQSQNRIIVVSKNGKAPSSLAGSPSQCDSL